MRDSLAVLERIKKFELDEQQRILAIELGQEESLQKKKDLWQYLKNKDAGLYYKLYFGIFGRAMNLPGKGGRKVSVFAYKLANKVMGFN